MLCTINNSGKHLSQNRNRLTAMENKFMVTEGESGVGGFLLVTLFEDIFSHSVGCLSFCLWFPLLCKRFMFN